MLVVLGSTAIIEAQQPRIYRVLIIQADNPYYAPAQIKGLRDRLSELGYIGGKNVVYDLLQEENYDALRASLKALVLGNVDVIVAIGQLEAALASELTDKIAIIFMPGGDPVGAGLVRSLAAPGTNLTGLTYLEPKAIAKQVQVFKEAVPSLRRMLVLHDSRNENASTSTSLSIVRKVAAHLKINLIERSVKSLSEGEQTISLLPTDPMTGVFAICSSLFRGIRSIASVAVQRKLPVFGCSARQVADEGVLITYAPDLYYIGNRAGWYLDRILRGARPQDLPVETPRKFDLAINLKTADAIGIKIPPEVLQRADKVTR
jgi:putative tryptophan/tyrosine transport system substrate-binding protein